MNSSYAWQEKKWRHLIARWRNHTFPHALLINGAEGVGKFDFACSLAQFLLCQNSHNKSGEYACGKCKSCLLFNSSSHPDFLTIQPQDNGKTIKVEQIRELITAIENTSNQGGYQVVIINPAETMNMAAANALLKTLEEPSGKTIIILISSQPASLPMTILSRCQRIELASPQYETAINWLQHQIPSVSVDDIGVAFRITNNAPLHALKILQTTKISMRKEFLNEILAISEATLGVSPNRVEGETKNIQGAITFGDKYVDSEINFLLLIFLDVVSDLLKLSLGVNDCFLINVDYRDKLHYCCAAKSFSAEKLLEFQKYLLSIKKILAQNIALNKQMLLEGVWLRWCNAFNSK